VTDISLVAIVLVLVLLCLLLVWLGYQLAVDNLRTDREHLDHQRVALRAEWQQLDRIRRVRAVFLSARRAMQAEADRHRRPTTDDRQGGV
jgi:Tfp pilus assembly protein PilN